MKITLIFCFMAFLVSDLSFGQMGPYINQDKFNWKEWESVKAKGEKLQIVESIAQMENFEKFQLGAWEKKLDNFKVIDIDADGIDDVVYSGPDEKGTPTVIFYRNDGENFKDIFLQYGHLIYVSRDKPWEPISFQIVKPIDDLDHELQICSHSFKDGHLNFTLTNTIIMRNGLKVLKENLPPMLFEIKDKSSELHLLPDPGQPENIKIYDPGDLGFAIGSEMNPRNEIWWFVLMKEPQNKLRAGWMNPKNLKRLRSL